MANIDPKLRVLVFCTGNIDRPRSGAELRVHYLFRELAARGHCVEAHSLVARNHPTGRIEVRDGFAVTKRHFWGLDAGLILDRTGIVPVTELPFFLAPLKAWVRSLTRAGNFDVAQFEFPWWARAMAGARGAHCGIVYGSHNVEWRWWWNARLRRMANGKAWRKRLYRHEVEAVGGADGVTAVTPADARWLPRHANRLGLVANGFDANRFGPASQSERQRIRNTYGWKEHERIALFVGSDTQPNREAAAFIAGELARSLRGQNVRLVIGGRVCSKPGRAAENVTVLGAVEDVLPLYQAADVGLNPMQSGGGSNIKLVEMCAAGLPVVTTLFGLRGFEGLMPLVRVAGLDAFAGAAMTTPRIDITLRNSLINVYSWAASAEKLEKFYAELIEAKRMR